MMPLVLGASLDRLSRSPGPEGTLFNLLLNVIYFNLILGTFNLIPVFPLDGFSVLEGVLPAELAELFAQTQQWGMFLLLGLILLDRYVNILGFIIDGPVTTLLFLLVRAGS
jgi:Zn-dependent protease